MSPEIPQRHTIDVDTLQRQLSVRQVAAYYGFVLPESFGDAGEQRMRCPCANCTGQDDDRSVSINVSDPFKPKKTGSVHLGGIVRKAPHPKSGPLNGGPQMVELSRDGKRAYLTNSLYASWDEQFYPDGIKSWATSIHAKPEGGLSLDEGFFSTFEQRTHQVHLQGGDASSDSYCYS